MILGRIRVRVEHSNPRWIFCRPVTDGNGRVFPSRIGTCHVVYIEKCELTENIVRGGEYTYFGIFDKAVSEEDFANGLINVKINPIPEGVYNNLLLIYPQKVHSFAF